MAVLFKSDCKIKLFALLVLVCSSFQLLAQPSMTRQEYIDKYAELAIEEMKRHKIPASITLAQALLESGNGNSTLAVKANNHFGIKCHNTWKGKTIRHDDDKKRECFRKYNTVLESYEDHSIFLVNTPRYKFLFSYKITDYRSWAKGLKNAGYATAKHYDKTLIEIIETYRLYKYDVMKEIPLVPSVEMAGKREILYNNNVKCVIFNKGDNLTDLSKEIERFKAELIKYNELNDETTLHEGMYVYLQPKRRANKKTNVHEVKTSDETLWHVSQKYGVKTKKLLKYNNIEDADEPLLTGRKVYLNAKAAKEQINKNESEERDEVQPQKTEEHSSVEEKTAPVEDQDTKGAEEAEFEFKLE